MKPVIELRPQGPSNLKPGVRRQVSHGHGAAAATAAVSYRLEHAGVAMTGSVLRRNQRRQRKALLPRLEAEFARRCVRPN